MIEILFNDFKLKVFKEEVQQFDSKTVDIFFSGEFDDSYIYKMYLSHNDNLDLIILTQTADGNYKTTLTETQLAFSGIYNIQILAIDKNDSDKKKHSNIVTFNCLESMSGNNHWITIPTEFTQFENRILNYIDSVENKLITHAEINNNGHLIFTFADDSTDDVGLIVPDISGKQDKTDNSLNTTDKTIVGAINELNTGKGTYSKPASGIPKSDLASGVQSSLDKADTALQQHQDVSGKADTSYVNTELSKKQDKFADVETSTGNTRLISPTSKMGIDCLKGIYFFNGIPTIGNAPINESDAVNKYYVDNFHDNTKLNTSRVKTAQSTTSGDVYDVTYINSLIGNIESLLSNLRGNAQ